MNNHDDNELLRECITIGVIFPFHILNQCMLYLKERFDEEPPLKLLHCILDFVCSRN